jgi:hypothetical protein
MAREILKQRRVSVFRVNGKIVCLWKIKLFEKVYIFYYISLEKY